MKSGQTKKRASTSRSRTGCPTCKIRHVRCDETRPNCRQCTSTGRTCDYPKSVPEQGKPISVSQVVLAKSNVSQPTKTIYSMPFQVPGSQKDRQVLHYYCTQAASDMSGFLPSDFWTNMLMRTSHDEPAVRNALVAFSSAKLSYETLSDGEMAIQTSPESQMHYEKALRQVRRYISTNPSPSAVVLLQCCILLHQFDSMRGDHHAALVHLENAFAILHSSTSQRSISSMNGAGSVLSDDMDEIQSVLVRMDLQASLFDDARVPTYQSSSLADCLNIPRFMTIRSAQKSLHYLLSSLWTFLTTNLSCKSVPLDMIPPAVTKEKQLLNLRFQAWEAACGQLAASLEPKHVQARKDRSSKAGLDLLSLLHKANRLLLDSNFPHDPSVFSKSPNPPVEEVLDLSEKLLSESEQNVSHGRRRVFSAETGVVAPLFLVAIKCSDPFLSSRAIDLLAKCSRREGLYDGELVLDILQAIQQQDAAPGFTGHSADAGEDDPEGSVPSPSNVALEMKASDIADLPGGLVVMAKMLGVKTDFIS